MVLPRLQCLLAGRIWAEAGGSTTATSPDGFFVIELSLAWGEFARSTTGNEPALSIAGLLSD